MDPTYYNSTTGQVYTAAELIQDFGVDPETTGILALNYYQIYPVQPSEPDFDTQLYTPSVSWSLVPILPLGEGAVRVYTPVAKPLPEAKENATVEAKDASNAEAAALITASGVNVDIWTGAASQDPGDRPPLYNTLLGQMATIGDTLATTLTAIDTATSVDEINNIINKPTGVINTGRGNGLGPEDLNVSYYVSFNSVSLTPEQTELYVPGTATVISYDPFLPPPYTFDSFGDCFNPGDYTLQIREVATSKVIAEFECPLDPLGVDVPF
jgi:hypothetical protein